jgi:hypothetical protein
LAAAPLPPSFCHKEEDKMPEPEKAKCESCSVTILATTAMQYDGYCAPCYKKFNEKPAVQYQLPKQSRMDVILGFLIPIGIIAIVLLGMPLGYRMVLGGPLSTIKSGTIRSATLIHDIPGVQINGCAARLVQDYLIVELDSDRLLWIPEENVAAIEFASK